MRLPFAYMFLFFNNKAYVLYIFRHMFIYILQGEYKSLLYIL